MAPDPDPKIGETVQDVAERMSVLVREEIELAKAEVEVKIKKLAAAAAVGAAAGVFIVVALLFVLHGVSWLFAQHLVDNEVWLGYLITSVILLLLAAIAGFLAYRFAKKGSPPTPQMAIEEAKLIKDTVSS